MLTKLEVRTAFGTMLSLPLQDISGGYITKDIEGLDPVKATLVFSSFAGQDGSQFQSARRENRNIIIKLEYQPNFAQTTVAKLRQKLYQFLMPKSLVQLRFYDDEVGIVNISGRVESFDSPRFTKDPDATIGIVCEIPDFDTLVNLQFGGNTTAGATTVDRTYDGTVETGFVFTMNVNRTISGFTIYNTLPDNTSRSLVITAPLVAGDVVKISTVAGSKYATLTRSGSTSSILYGVSRDTNWLNLFQGVNKFRVLLAGAAVPWTIDYTTKYGGL
jgi:hypothetical protein